MDSDIQGQHNSEFAEQIDLNLRTVRNNLHTAVGITAPVVVVPTPGNFNPCDIDSRVKQS